jgi:hypothetical protein
MQESYEGGKTKLLNDNNGGQFHGQELGEPLWKKTPFMGQEICPIIRFWSHP